MSVLSIVDLLQAQHRTLPGVKSAPAAAEYPEAINSVALPLALSWPAQGQWRLEDVGDQRRQDRSFVVQIFVKAGTQGRGVGPAIVTIGNLIQAFGERYLDPAGFVLDEAPQITIRTDEGQLSDTGAALLRYAGAEFHGFQFTVRVYEHW